MLRRAIWYTVAHGSGLGFENSEDFFHASGVISEAVEQAVLSGKADDLTALSSLLDRAIAEIERDSLELKNKEYALLLFRMLNVDIVFSRETLYEKIWGMDAMGDNAAIAVPINRLREKIEADSSRPRYIQTVWGAGNRFGN